MIDLLGHMLVTQKLRPTVTPANANPSVTGTEREGDYWWNIATGALFQYSAGAWAQMTSDSGYQELAAQFNTTSGTPVDITGMLGFTPVVNATYDLEWFLLFQSTAAGTGLQPSWGIPTGLAQFGYAQWVPSNNYTNEISQWGGPIVPSATTAAPAANVTFAGSGQAVATIGAAPGAGNIRPRIQSENAGTQVSVMPGSWFRWQRTS